MPTTKTFSSLICSLHLLYINITYERVKQTAVYHYFNHYLPEFRRLLGVRMVMDGWMATIRASEGVYVKKSTYYIVALLV